MPSAQKANPTASSRSWLHCGSMSAPLPIWNLLAGRLAEPNTPRHLAVEERVDHAGRVHLDGHPLVALALLVKRLAGHHSRRAVGGSGLLVERVHVAVEVGG